MKIIFRDGKEAGEREREYIEKFANPFPAATRGQCLVEIWVLMKCTTTVMSEALISQILQNISQ